MIISKKNIVFLSTQKINKSGPDEMLQTVALHLGLHCSLRFKQPLGTL